MLEGRYNCIEIKSKGILLSYCTPSPHKDGSKYKIIGTEEIKKIDANVLEERITDICKRFNLRYTFGFKSTVDMTKIIKV